MLRALNRKVLAATALLVVLPSCGGHGGATAQAKKVDLDADPVALLPSAPLVVASIDARGSFANADLGPRLSELADRLVPIGEDAGFKASRDVDRAFTAAYATGDGVAVLRGRFDAAKMEAATVTTGGLPVVHGSYAGRVTSTIGRVAFAVLTPATLVAGTGDGLRRALDRVTALQTQGALAATVPPWMSETLATPNAALAAAGDFANVPVAAATLASLRVPWLHGLQRARLVVEMREPGLHVAAALTYGDPAQAEQAASGVRSASRWLRVLGPFVGGVDLQGFDVASEANDTRCTFAVDDRTLSTLISLASRLHP
jgi:hypothetical protein